MLGRGQPHSPASFAAKAHDMPPTLALMNDLQASFFKVVSLEWALGSLDDLQQTQARRRSVRSA